MHIWNYCKECNVLDLQWPLHWDMNAPMVLSQMFNVFSPALYKQIWHTYEIKFITNETII